jgi:hypothetical protein
MGSAAGRSARPRRGFPPTGRARAEGGGRKDVGSVARKLKHARWSYAQDRRFPHCVRSVQAYGIGLLNLYRLKAFQTFHAEQGPRYFGC